MGISINEIVTGRKTFFITPDTSLFPRTFLEDYFALGYEGYFIEYDKRVTIEKKLEVILSLFKDAILFFNIDFVPEEFDWYEIIRRIRFEYGERVLIGVFYTKRPTVEEKKRIERKYLFDLGVQCGCIQLEYQKKINFNIIGHILAANQAQGRRKNIRAICTKACTYSVTYNGIPYSGILQDISSSHFSIVTTDDDDLHLQAYEKLSNLHINLKGFLFTSDAIMVLSRKTEAGTLYIFAFVSAMGGSGLEPRIKQLLTSAIYNLMNYNFNSIMKQMTEGSPLSDSEDGEEFVGLNPDD